MIRTLCQAALVKPAEALRSQHSPGGHIAGVWLCQRWHNEVIYESKHSCLGIVQKSQSRGKKLEKKIDREK